MSRPARPYRVEIVGEIPAKPTPELIRYVGRRMADIHIARMQAASAAQELSSVEECSNAGEGSNQRHS